MKQEAIYYWSENCDRKAMAEAVAREVREFSPDSSLKKGGRVKKKVDFQTAGGSNPLLSASNNLWRKGQWVRYWEERMKAYGAEIRPVGVLHFGKPAEKEMGESNPPGKESEPLAK